MSPLFRGFSFEWILNHQTIKYFLTASRPPSSYRCVRSETTLHLLIQSVAFRQSTAFSDCPNGSIPEPPAKPWPGSCQPSLLFPLHRTHASPVNRCSSFVVSKQSCQTIAAAAINLFINFYDIAAPAMPFGCSASLRSLSCYLQFLLIPHGSYCILHATSFIPSSVPLHYTSFVAIH